METSTQQQHASRLSIARENDRQKEIDELERQYALPSAQKQAVNPRWSENNQLPHPNNIGAGNQIRDAREMNRQLKEIRKTNPDIVNKKDIKRAKKDLKKKINPFSLSRHIDPFLDWLFGIGLILSILKDVLDIINNALIAAGGSGILLLVVFSIIVSIVLFFITILTSSVANSSGRLKYKIFKKLILIILGFFVEAIPALSLLPWESIITAIIYWMTLNERRLAVEIKNQEDELSQKIMNRNYE